MMKKYIIVFLTVALVFSMAAGALANQKFLEDSDGRNGNSDKNGSFEIVVPEGPYYVDGKVTVSVIDLIIDGPIDTLVITGNEVTLRDTPGAQTISVTATTYFKNGKKAGMIHTQISGEVTVTVEERPAQNPAVQWTGEYVFIATSPGNADYFGYAKILYNGVPKWEQVARWSGPNVSSLATKSEIFGEGEDAITVTITFSFDKVVSELPPLN